MYRYFVISSLISTASAFCQQTLPCEIVQDNYEAFFRESLLKLNVDSETVNRLFSYGTVAEQEDDTVLRPKYISIQAAFEQLLAHELMIERLKQVIAVIHTPMPATPLCTEGEVTTELVDRNLLKDEKRMRTISKRSETLRTILQSGGTLMAAYPGLARTKRSPSQLAIFEDLLKKYAKNLFDIPMGCLDVAPEMIGATYIFETMQGKWLTFSIRATQANAIETPASSTMWFGSVDKGPAAVRLAQVSAYLRACQGPDLISYTSP